ncbi:hypothetical protein GDO81_020335 [Engystomops pustulosus]|uniref:Urokinase plasminogen activator surface receptor n=1 Tax=Engystomops pustulosus TaxID=76066 RepID=A0AAV6Z9D0_ENGPU|nr:hypothetical protein GDO81_020335 [Engystomops pustulosus]
MHRYIYLMLRPRSPHNGGAHIMERSLLLGCLLALVIPANALRCHTCVGNGKECSSTEVTCPENSDQCSTSVMNIDSFPCKVQKIFKGCINSNTTSKKISLSPDPLITMSLQQEMCKSDLCNTQETTDPVSDENDLHCYSCISPGRGCNSDTMKQMKCKGDQNQCVDLKIVGSIGDLEDVNIKGCGHIPSHKKNMAFSSQTSSVSVQCCKENFCNSVKDPPAEDKTPNGVQCYSCNTLDGAKCSPDEIVKAQCYGDLTSCLEVAGTSTKDGRSIPMVIKGCASPSICDSLVLPLLQKMGFVTVKCCNQSLCNNQFSESGFKESGYLPIGNDSPGTGIQHTSGDAHGGNYRRYRHSDIKTGPHTNHQHGSGSYNYDGYSESNDPKMSPGNSNDEGIKGGSWNSNSGYPKPFPNEFSNTDAIYNPSITESDLYQGNSDNDMSVKNPNSVYGSNSFSHGDQNLGDSGSIPGVPSTTPDFTGNADNNVVPNSYYPNNLNNPNNNDLSGFESGGFTEIVYVDMGEDNDQSPTVASDIVSIGYGSVNNSGTANNPNTVLLANRNETSEYSSNVTNTGSNVNGNISNIHNFTSPGGSGYGGEGGSNYSNSSTNYSSSVPDVPPTMPDLTSYVDSNIVPNSYDDNDTNNTNNEFDYNWPEGFTEIVYSEIDWNNDQSGSPTVASEIVVTNSYDSVGNSGNGNSTNSDTVLLGKNNETSGYSTNMTHSSSNVNVYGNNSNTHNFTSPGGAGHGGEGGSNSGSYTNNNSSSLPEVPPTMPDFPSYVDSNIVSSSYNVNNMNNPNNNDSDYYETEGFTEIVYSEMDWNNGQSGSPTVASDIVDSVGNSENSNSAYNPNNILLGHSNETTEYSSDMTHTGSIVNNGKVQNQTLTNQKIYNSDIKQHMSGQGIDFYNTNIANNNGSGNYISSSGNSPTGSGNNPNVSTSGSSSFGGYTNTPGGNGSSPTSTNSGYSTGLANEWNHNNISSHPNMAVPVGYANIPGSNYSSSSYGSSGNGTGLADQWINSNNASHNMIAPVGYSNNSGNNNSATSYTGVGTGTPNQLGYDNSSNHNMIVPGGYAVPGSNGSSTYGNGTGMTHGGNNTYISNPNVTVPGGYVNVSGGNGSSTSYVSSGNGTGMIHGGSNSHSSNITVPGGYANVPGSNGSSTSYTNYANGTGMTHGGNNSHSSNPNITVPGGYVNVPGGNGSSTSYTSSGNGTGMIHGGNNSHSSNITVPGGYANVPGANDSSISYTSSGNGTVMTSGGSNSNSSNSNMTVPGGYANIPGSNSNSSNTVMPGGGYGNTNGSYPSSGSGNETAWIYSSNYNPNMNPNNMPPGSPNSNGFSWPTGFNWPPNITNGEYVNGPVFGNGYNSYAVPPDGNNNAVGSGGPSDGHGLNGSVVGNGNYSGTIFAESGDPNELVPGRSTNDSTIAGAGNSTEGGSGSASGSSTALRTKSGSFVIFSAIVLLVLT